MEPPSFSVVIPAYGHCPKLGACLTHLMNQTVSPLEIIVFHSGPSNPEFELKVGFPTVVFIHEEKKSFAGAARNAGVRALNASCDQLAFVDSDVLTAPDWIEQLGRAAIRYPNALVFGSLDCANQNSLVAQALWHIESGSVMKHLPSEPRPSGPGASFCMRKTLFESVGGFRDELSAGEDGDLCCRVRAAGAPVVFFPDARAAHVFTEEFSEFLPKLLSLGKAGAELRLSHDLPGTLFARYPVMAPALFPIRLGQISLRTFRCEGPVGSFLLSLPLIMVGLSAWVAGFMMGSTRSRSGATERH